MIKPITTPGRTYAVTSPNGCTVTQHVGEVDIVTDVPAGLQTLIIAHAGKFEIDDDSAIVTECGGSAELVFTAATTRAASSGSGCDCGFTAEECDKLKLYASAEGRNIPISEDGEIVTEVGHTYTITAGEMPVKCTDADFNPLCEVAAHKQIGFVAPTTAAYVDPVTCAVTEVFRAAAPIMLSGNGSGGEDGLPAGYTRVEYLEQTEKTQFINTGIALSDTYEVEAKYGIKPEDYTKNINVAITSEAILMNLDKNTIYLWSSWGRDGYAAASVQNDKKEINTLLLKRGYIQINDKSSIFRYGSNYSEDSTIIFGQLDVAVQAFARVYYLAIWVDNVLVRNFVPCVDNDGNPCMFDKVNKVAHYNEGTGGLRYPIASTTFALRRVLPEWGQLTKYGLRRLYHAPAGYQGELIDYALENGYKPIVEPEMPAEGYWAPQWRETEEEIVLEWIETEAPEMEEV